MSAYGTPATGDDSILTRQEIAFILGMYVKDAEERERTQALSPARAAPAKDALQRTPE